MTAKVTATRRIDAVVGPEKHSRTHFLLADLPAAMAAIVVAETSTNILDTNVVADPLADFSFFVGVLPDHTSRYAAAVTVGNAG